MSAGETEVIVWAKGIAADDGGVADSVLTVVELVQGVNGSLGVSVAQLTWVRGAVVDLKWSINIIPLKTNFAILHS